MAAASPRREAPGRDRPRALPRRRALRPPRRDADEARAGDGAPRARPRRGARRRRPRSRSSSAGLLNGPGGVLRPGRPTRRAACARSPRRRSATCDRWTVVRGDRSAAERLGAASSARIASASGGHAASAQSPNSRSVRQAQATRAAGIDPEERAGAAEVAERRGRVGGAGPVRALRVLELEAEAPVVRLLAAEPGKDADEARERDRRRLGQRLGRDERRREQLAPEARPGRRAAPRCPPTAGRAARAPRGRAGRGRPPGGSRRTASRPAPRGARRAGRSPCWSRSAARPGFAIGAVALEGKPGGVREQVADGRARAARPARRGRATPSSAATSAAYAVKSFVTDAQRRTSRRPARARRPRPPRRRPRPPPSGAGQASICCERLHGRAILEAMERQIVSSGSPYEPVVGYSRAVRVGDRVFVAGSAPIMADGSDPPADAYGQARRCLEIVGDAAPARRARRSRTSSARAST